MKTNPNPKIPDEMNVVIEIPANSEPINYEIDKYTGYCRRPSCQNFPFFKHYKDLEPGKWIIIEGWFGVDRAKGEISSGIERYQKLEDKPVS